MSTVQLTDEPLSESEHQVAAVVPAATYADMCKTLGCDSGQVAAVLLQRVQQDTENRLYGDALQVVRQVRAAGKLSEFNALFDVGGSQEALLKK